MAPAERTRTTAQAQAEGLRVFVAGIPWNLKEDTLRRDFEECGVVEDIFILKDQEGNSKGRAFITFRESAGVEAALKFDNTPYGGRTIFVKVADEKKKGEASGKRESTSKAKGQSKENGQDKPQPSAEKEFPTEKPEGCVSLCLKNIGDATQADVRTFLKGCTVQSVRLVMDRRTGAARGIAFVDFPSTEEVDKAMAINGTKLNGSVVEMYYEKPRQRPRPEGCMCVAVKKLGPHTTEKEVRKLFKGLESLSEVRVICEQGKCIGLAFAEFTDAADVEAAIRRDGMSLRGQTVFICYETKAKKERDEPAKALKGDGDAAAAGKRRKKDAPDKKGPQAKKSKLATKGELTEKQQAAVEGKKNRKREAQKARKKRKRGAEQPAARGAQEPAEAPGAAEEAAPAEAPRKKKKRKKAGGEPDAA